LSFFKNKLSLIIGKESYSSFSYSFLTHCWLFKYCLVHVSFHVHCAILFGWIMIVLSRLKVAEWIGLVQFCKRGG